MCSSAARRSRTARSPAANCAGTTDRFSRTSTSPSGITPRARAPHSRRVAVVGPQGRHRRRAAAALHGASPVVECHARRADLATRPAAAGNRRTQRADLAVDEIADVDGIAVTTPARTALDLARHLPRDLAVRHLDALAASDAASARPMSCRSSIAIAEHAACGRPVVALSLMDGGARSARETRLRLALIDGGLPCAADAGSW